MFKPIILSLAGPLALSLCAFAAAADKEPAAGSASASKREHEYLSTLKRCEALGAAEKAACIDAAKKKYGQI
ncbi:MAG TPA: hypothetical protein VHB46_13685 [Burkholderiales bacterium]|nr:hypothetical protein [Burkholderiales bacterium]